MRKNKIYLETVTRAEALQKWLGALRAAGVPEALGAEEVAVAEALGRVTAEPVFAALSCPFYHASAMDGYAVRFRETFGAHESSPMLLALGSGAVYVDTGDPVPEGMDAVIMIEDVNMVDRSIEIIAPATPWQNVRVVGEDLVATELITPENHVIRPVDMGALLAGGLTHLKVRRRPRVAVLPTGTEIVEPGTALKRGDIIEYNSRVLEGLLRELGAEPLRMPIVPDDQDKLRDAIKAAAGEADFLIINAGASSGSEDYTASLVAELGEVVVHGVDIKPGKPVLLGLCSGKPVLGTPGYPVATYLTFQLFARPLIKRWLGLEDRGLGHGTLEVMLSRQVSSPLGLEEFLRVKVGRVGEKFIATPLGRGAGLITSLVRADGVLMVPAMSEGLASGSMVQVELVRPRAEIEDTAVSIGSHDMAMDLLASALKRRHSRYTLSSAHVGSLGGLRALKKGEAHLAPTHMLDEETGVYNRPFIERLMPGREVRLINLVYRTQGLMVAKGNPLGFKDLRDLARPEAVFINRQRGAGTRMLLDMHLKQLGMEPSSIQGYEREEYTHMAVASAVLTGVANVGLGVLSAANALGLDFIPVAEERYDLAVPAENLDLPIIKAVIEVIREDRSFRDSLLKMGGYDLRDMGREM